MGAHLCQAILGKSVKKASGKAHKVDGKIYIPTESSLDLHLKGNSCINALLLAHRYETGSIIDKDYTDYEVVVTVDRLREILPYVHITGICAFDYETTGFEYFDKELKGTVLSLTFQPGYSYIIPFEHKDFDWGDDFETVLNLLREFFADPSFLKVAHNTKFDINWHSRYKIEVIGRVADTMVMAQLLDENRRVGLKLLTKQYFPFWEGYDDGVDYLGPLAPLAQYAAIDTDITLRLYYIFLRQLYQIPKLYLYFRNMSMFALKPLAKMERYGARLNRDYLVECLAKAKELIAKKEFELKDFKEVKKFIIATNQQKIEEAVKIREWKITTALEKYGKETANIARWKQEIRDLKTGQQELYTEVNFASTQQMAGLLYDGFKFKVPNVKGERKRSTSRDYIQGFDHPFINTLLAYRSISKMISTYYEGLLKRMDSNDHVHCSFNQARVVTGRLSSSDPNLQNIPARLHFQDEDAEWVLQQVKRFFVPISDEHYIIQADYSQAELRVIANFSGDEVMRQAYVDGEDLHAKTGAQIMNLTLEEFKALPPKEYKKGRSNAKPANFGWVYKASLEGYQEFAKNQYGVELTIEECEIHRNAIFKTYPKIAEWHAVYENKVKTNGYVETLLGRRRHLPDVHSTNSGVQEQAIRHAVNAPIQGTAGEYTIFCIAWLQHRLPKECIMWSTVHDSIFFYIRKDQLHLLEIINETCQNPPIEEYFKVNMEDNPIPMKMDYEITDKSWRDMEEIGDWEAVTELLGI